jgi:type IV secretory pathway protease TraF
MYYLGLCKYTFAQRQNRLRTYFSKRIPLVKRRISALLPERVHCMKSKQAVARQHPHDVECGRFLSLIWKALSSTVILVCFPEYTSTVIRSI